MALAELDYALKIQINVTAKKAKVAAAIPAPARRVEATPAYSVKKTAANNAAGGGDQCYSAVVEVGVGVPVNLDLTSLTNVADEPTVAFARVKAFTAQLLGTADDPANGNACSGVEIAAGASNGWLGLTKTAGDAITLGNGDTFAKGTNAAGGWAVDATHKILTLTCTDGAVPARVLITAAGGTT